MSATAAGRRLRAAETRLTAARGAYARRPNPTTLLALELAERAVERASDRYLTAYVHLVTKDATK